MKSFLLLAPLFFLQLTYAQVTLDSDGPGGTYELITSVLAPNNNPIEVPDCNHMAFGDHIDELFDEELNTNVFRFYIHTMPDNDRCINFDRQRNEIKSYGASPDNLLGVESEKVVYTWKFKLAAGFQSSPNFTHLHQLKSVGGDLASMPMYTLTTRKGNPDRLELRYAETSSQVTLTQTPLTPFIDTWLEVTETIEYGLTGTYEIEIKRVDDEAVLFAYADDNIVNWRPGADFVRPKWGIYRSLLNAQDLRDEAVLFANFSIEEIDVVSSVDTGVNDNTLIVFPNPLVNKICIKQMPKEVSRIQVFSLDGRKVLEERIDAQTAINLDVSALASGAYVVSLSGEGFKQSELVVILP